MMRFILLLASLYPRSWKQCYGAEFNALLEDLNPCWWDALDVLKGAAMMQMIRWIVMGVAAMGTVAMAGAVLFYFAHHHTERASEQRAEAEFQRLRARFAGQKPLLDMGERRPFLDTSAQPKPAVLHAFHTVIFDTRGGERLVRVTVPYRFGRLFGRGGFRWLGQLTFLDDTEFDPEPIQLSLDQIARHGLGLVVDYQHASGGQFIAWVE
jgi:hypothetical protein